MKMHFRVWPSLALLLICMTGVMAQPVPAISGVVHGLVTDDSTGLPIPRAAVIFYSVNHSWSNAIMLSDSSGHYSMRLDTGNYFGVSMAIHYFPEWYNNVGTRDSATWLTVAKGETTVVNFGLRRIPPPVFVDVRGTVTDSVSGLPLPGVLVAYYRPFHWPPIVEQTGLLTGVTPPVALWGPSPTAVPGPAWLGHTDSLGRYTAHVPAGVTLIAGTFKFGYVPEFFDDKRSPFDADKLFFTHDSSGFDFDLLRVPLDTNSISGTVVDSAGSGVPSHLLLVQPGPGLTPWRVWYGTTDSNGHYTFGHLPESNYLVEALPFGRNLPSWYDADSCGVFDWHRADPVHAAGAVAGINICVKVLPGPGIGLIAGNVFNGVVAGAPQGAPGIGGVVVYAVSTATDEILGFDITDSDGSYAIENLPPGSYRVAADKAGYTSSSMMEYSLGPQNNYEIMQNSIGITPDSPLSVHPGHGAMPNEFRLDQNYPNPFNPSTRVSFVVGQTSFVRLKVYDLLGREVATLVNEMKQPGVYQANWDGANFPSGVYSYRLTAGTYTGVKKMILLK